MHRSRWVFAIFALVVTITRVGSTQPPDVATLGPKVGSRVPAFSAVDQFGRTRTLESLLDRDGLMLVFFRSADW